MYQFKVKTDELNKRLLEISGKEAHHIIRVLRLKEGSIINLFDGEGKRARAIISNISNDSVEVELFKEKLLDTEPGIQVTLYQSLPKKDKLELIIQKATELGVKNIVPIITKRTIVTLDKERVKKKMDRWIKIAQEACKQSKRALIPSIKEPQNFLELIEHIQEDILLIPYEEEIKGLKQLLPEIHNIAVDKDSLKIGILIGPEGGWELKEVELAKQKGAIPFSLGPRILRTETASIAALTIILYELGDLGGIIFE